MIHISVASDGYAPILAMLDRVARPDLGPLAETIRGRLVEGNRAGLEAGTDAKGKRLADLAPSTLLDRRRGQGGPMIPISPGRRFIEGFRAGADRQGDGYVVTGEWDPVARFHRTSARTGSADGVRRPARDIVGIRPDDWKRIGDDVREFARLIMRY